VAEAHSDPARPDVKVTPGLLAALITGQLGLHSAMAGLRLAAPLQLLESGASAWTVGVLLALFAAAPVLLAMPAGRLADRHGYHRPVRLATGMALLGMALAVGSTWTEGAPALVLLGLAAMLTGTAANTGMLTIQRTTGLVARDGAERVRMFSWLGVAPSLANVVGPVAVGVVIDLAGFRAGYAMLLLLPLLSWASARRVPRLPPSPTARAPRGRMLDLLAAPGMKRLLTINWLLATCWDVHAFAVPILGHGLGFSASVIGLILGTFTLAVSLVRMALPWFAHRVSEVPVIRAAMLGSAAVFLVYPWAETPGIMALCAASLGVALGVAQPMIMATLHRLTPGERHGEALAFRSMAINASSTLMPLLFGAAGAVVGAGVLFWVVGGLVGAGSTLARALAPRPSAQP
jgi:MFS family permease